MRRWVGIILLLFFAWVLAGVFPAQWALRQSARREMQALIRARGERIEGVVELSFPTFNGEVRDPAFHWEDAHEFSVDGVLYDVITSRVEDGRIIFQCVADGKEQHVLRVARDLLPATDRNVPASGGSLLVLKILSDHYLGKDQFFASLIAQGDRTYGSASAGSVRSGFPHDRFRPPAA